MDQLATNECGQDTVCPACGHGLPDVVSMFLCREEDMRNYTQFLEYQNAQSMQSLHQVGYANFEDKETMRHLEEHNKNLEYICNESRKKQAALEIELKKAIWTQRSIQASLNDVQMDREAAWRTAQRIGELFTTIGSPWAKEVDATDVEGHENRALWTRISSLLLDNKKMEAEVVHLKHKVEKAQNERPEEVAWENQVPLAPELEKTDAVES